MEEINAISQSRDDTKKLVSRLSSCISSKALAMTKMISWRKVKAKDAGEDQSEEAISQSRDDTKKLVSRLSSSISSKALAMTRMISWRKVKAEDADEDQSDEAIWRKSIMMGERCRPLDFSREIVYDSQGNLLSDVSH
ncbi:hypothetical protein FNV43_RR14941 [Rhamnella rubrinervis]|uniref:Uncharacterized protein n=1 Tax=Rhamnella rubrinervis TaxID=2594499 RepID=A0A8K0H3R2_9ROSA|nr:hypothetical protein FNV43_RR14941 [Rhamnella rubrinervis]